MNVSTMPVANIGIIGTKHKYSNANTNNSPLLANDSLIFLQYSLAARDVCMHAWVFKSCYIDLFISSMRLIFFFLTPVVDYLCKSLQPIQIRHFFFHLE